MTIRKLSTNQSRILYDFVVCLGASVLTSVFNYIFKGELFYALFASPFLGVFANYLLGINSRFRLASGRIKTVVLSVSVFLVGFALWLMTRDLPTCLMWASFAWAPLVLPRIFLNLHRQQKLGGAFGETIVEVIRDRGPVLVVGGAGYIGTHVVAELLREGYPVRVLDRLFYGKNPIQDLLGSNKLDLIEGDVTDINKLVHAVDGASAIVHLAGLVGDPACSVDDRYTTHCNVIATRMLKEVARAFGVQRFVFASSCSVYGASDEVVDENSDLNPVSLYARTKIESEKELLGSLTDDFFVTVLRFATVFGHSRRPRFDLVANLFTAQAFVDGKITVHGGDQARPFVHVFDLARAILLVLKAKPFDVAGQVFNVGDERLNTTVGKLATAVQQVVSAERPVELACFNEVVDRRNYIVSFDKIRRVLGFQAAISIEEGVSEMVREFKAGRYADYKLAHYSNLETTKGTIVDFNDPSQLTNLYGPLAVNQSG